MKQLFALLCTLSLCVTPNLAQAKNKSQTLIPLQESCHLIKKPLPLFLTEKGREADYQTTLEVLSKTSIPFPIDAMTAYTALKYAGIEPSRGNFLKLITENWVRQPTSARTWDNMSDLEKQGRKYMNGILTRLVTYTELPPDDPDCKTRKQCGRADSSRVKDGKAVACACPQKCEGRQDLQGCVRYCCPGCGCGDCVLSQQLDFIRDNSSMDIKLLLEVLEGISSSPKPITTDQQ